MRQLPNILTVSRIVLAALFLAVFFWYSPWSPVLALAIFLAAAATDYYDGYFAKKMNGVTDFGKIMDPIADKVLILAAFYSLSKNGWVPFFMFAIIVVREIGITLFRMAAMSRGKVLAAERHGKIKTVAQMVTVISMLLTGIFVTTGVANSFPVPFYFCWSGFILLSLWAAVILTVTSGVAYLWNNWKTVYA